MSMKKEIRNKKRTLKIRINNINYIFLVFFATDAAKNINIVYWI